MKLTELIEKATEAYREYGDIEVSMLDLSVWETPCFIDVLDDIEPPRFRIVAE